MTIYGSVPVAKRRTISEESCRYRKGSTDAILRENLSRKPWPVCNTCGMQDTSQEASGAAKVRRRRGDGVDRCGGGNASVTTLWASGGSRSTPGTTLTRRRCRWEGGAGRAGAAAPPATTRNRKRETPPGLSTGRRLGSCTPAALSWGPFGKGKSPTPGSPSARRRPGVHGSQVGPISVALAPELCDEVARTERCPFGHPGNKGHGTGRVHAPIGQGPPAPARPAAAAAAPARPPSSGTSVRASMKATRSRISVSSRWSESAGRVWWATSIPMPAPPPAL